MEKRTLTITIESDWRGQLRAQAARAFMRQAYAGETLNFESPGAFFANLSTRRWAILDAMLGSGEMPVRELARRMGRDVKRVHEDASALVALGLLERTARGGLQCPYPDIHLDMHMKKAA